MFHVGHSTGKLLKKHGNFVEIFLNRNLKKDFQWKIFKNSMLMSNFNFPSKFYSM